MERENFLKEYAEKRKMTQRQQRAEVQNGHIFINEKSLQLMTVFLSEY